MGYRTTFVSEEVYIKLPEWFTEKWDYSVHFHTRPDGLYGGGAGDTTLPISSKQERKFHMGAQDELFIDLAKVLRETSDEWVKSIDIVMMHEDGMVDKVIVHPDRVVLQRSLRYDSEDDYNPQLGDSEEYIIPKERDNG